MLGQQIKYGKLCHATSSTASSANNIDRQIAFSHIFFLPFFLNASNLLFPSLRSKKVEFTAMREQYMRGGEGFIVCYSITDRHSFLEAEEYRNLILKVGHTKWSE